jgi:ribonuclease HI
VESFLSDVNQSKNTTIKGGTAPKHDRPKWVPSPVGVVKVNVDAAVARRKDHRVIAAVARRTNGEYLGSLAVLLWGNSDSEVLEVLAVREGTNLALDLSVQRIRVASDCLSVVKAMKESKIWEDIAISCMK